MGQKEMKTTTFIESKNNWCCLFCHNINTHDNIQCHNCEHTQGVFERILRPKMKYTIKEWKQFKQFREEQMNGEKYYTDVQMLMVQQYDIILVDHVNKRSIGKICPTPLKETLKTIPSKITPENISKGFKMLDKGMTVFNKTVQDFGKSMDLLTNEMSNDVKKGNKTANSEAKKNKRNLDKIYGKKKSKAKIWKDKPKKRKTRKKLKSDQWDKREHNFDKIWGK
jgi:hypothetical protein